MNSSFFRWHFFHIGKLGKESKDNIGKKAFNFSLKRTLHIWIENIEEATNPNICQFQKKKRGFYDLSTCVCKNYSTAIISIIDDFVTIINKKVV